jgi:hypothetical protein
MSINGRKGCHGLQMRDIRPMYKPGGLFKIREVSQKRALVEVRV